MNGGGWADSLLWPLNGTRHFLARPRWWWLPIRSGFLPLLIGGVITSLIGWWRWPQPDEGEWTIWLIFSWIGKLVSSIVVLAAICMPFLRGGLGRDVLRRALIEQGLKTAPTGALRSWKEDLRYLILTLPWRLFWLIALSLAWQVDGISAIIVGVWGLGHLLCLTACDNALYLQGVGFSKRRWAMFRNGIQLLVAGLLAGFGSIIAAVTVLGWFVLSPGIAVGAAKWTWHWPEAVKARQLAYYLNNPVLGSQTSELTATVATDTRIADQPQPDPSAQRVDHANDPGR